jgi:hypothetical protein
MHHMTRVAIARGEWRAWAPKGLWSMAGPSHVGLQDLTVMQHFKPSRKYKSTCPDQQLGLKLCCNSVGTYL